jgi:hypothetical protein
MFRYLFDEVSDRGFGLADHVNDFWTWFDGEYVSWPDWRDAQLREAETPEQFKPQHPAPAEPTTVTQNTVVGSPQSEGPSA